MSNRLDQDKEKNIEPLRMDYAIFQIKELGFTIINEPVKHIEFMFKGSLIKFYPYSGWATGKTIKDGRGIGNLIKQLK